MSTLTVAVPDDQLLKLKERAARLNVSPEELVRASIEELLARNGYEINAGLGEQETVILRVASGDMKREEFTVWLRNDVVARRG